MCGSTFEVVKSWQKRCSAKCNSIAGNMRRRADPSVKNCRTCRESIPVGEFHAAHRSCIACEELHASGRKRCGRCRDVKGHASFYVRPKRPDGYDSRCRSCRSEESRVRNADPDKKRINRDKKLRLKYGIGADHVDEMLRQQQGACGICGTTDNADRFHVDHNHATGAVRALLCFHCNALLGHVKEDVTILREAILYLERHPHDQDMGP